MDGLNLSLFNLIHDMSGRGYLIDAAGIFTAQYLPYLMFLVFLWLAVFQQAGLRKKIFFLTEAAIALILSRGIITEIIRFFYYSPRPFETMNFQSLISESGSSIPSGHAAFFFALATIIYFYDKRWGIWYFILSLLVSFARVFTGVHWPLDIVAGAVVGILGGILVHSLLKSYFKKLKEHMPSTANDEL